MRIGLGQIWLELSDFQNITAVETFAMQNWLKLYFDYISPWLLWDEQIVALATCFISIVIWESGQMPTNSSTFLCLVRKFQIGRADNQSSCGFLHQQWLPNARINQQRPNQGIDTCLLIFLVINQNKSRQQTSFSFCLFINHHSKAFQDWSGC